MYVPISTFLLFLVSEVACGEDFHHFCHSWPNFQTSFLQMLQQLRNFFRKFNSMHHPRTRRHLCQIWRSLAFLELRYRLEKKQSPTQLAYFAICKPQCSVLESLGSQYAKILTTEEAQNCLVAQSHPFKANTHLQLLQTHKRYRPPPVHYRQRNMKITLHY